MPHWQNWSATQRCTPLAIFQPRSLEELQKYVRRAASENKHIRPFGTGHAWSAMVPTDDYLLDMTRLNQCLDQGDGWIHVEGGMLAREMNRRLAASGQMVPSQTIYQGITVGGMVATGSHGSDLLHGSLSDQVLALTLVRADGEVVQVSANHLETYRAAKISLGLLGVIYSVKLRCLPAVQMLTEDRVVPLEEGLQLMPMLAREHDHLSAYWIPYTDKLWFYLADRTDAPVDFTRLRRTQDQARQYVWFRGMAQLVEWLTRARPDVTPSLLKFGGGFLHRSRHVRHSLDAHHYLATFPKLVDCEFAVPLERAEAGYRALIDLIRRYRAKGQYPVNLAVHARFVRGGDAFLSPTDGRDSMCIEAATARTRPETAAFYRDFGDCMMAEFDGRAHWGKQFYNLPMLRRQYGAKLHAFERVRLGFDPAGVFLNQTLRTLLHAEAPAPVGPQRTPVFSQAGAHRT